MTTDTEGRSESESRQTASPESVIAEPAQAEAQLSGASMLRRGVVRWLFTGALRVTYRGWTRIAARVFPEDSAQERLASALGVPLPDRLNLSWITPQLAVGGRIHPDDIPRLAATGVTRVVDTRSEHRDDEAALAAHHILLLYLPTPDTYPLSIEDLRRGTDWITAQIATGQRVLIHCEHGVGRSVLLTAAALVAGGMSAEDAISLVQSRRWQAAPNHRQMVRLQEFERAIRTPA
ncbi:MAG: hypothetical protein PVSMB4_06430 [Ktedonobacterales bacterium]